MKAIKTLSAIDTIIEAEQEREHRAHLGASVLGRKCMRQVWYVWRWAAKELFDGRRLRLFERGQLEEPRFFDYLKKIGCEVWPLNPETGKQWRVTFANGHGGGSADGIGRGIPDLPAGTPFLVECKTHNDKSFKELEKEGLCGAKPEHFAQTQIYTVKLELPAALYMAANKNDDSLHLEVIQPNPTFVATLLSRAEDIVASETPPEKINRSPAFYICRFCHFKDICHSGMKPEQNCRTCYFSKPIAGGEWICQKFNYPLTTKQQRLGCQEYRMKPGFME